MKTPLNATGIIFGENSVQPDGFTLVEALISLVVITLCVMTFSAAFFAGLQNLRDEGRMLEIVNYAAGKMDESIATDFSNVTGGSDQVTVKGENVSRQWVVTQYDVDGDLVPEADAKLITVTIDRIELKTLLVDSAGAMTCKR